MARSILYDDAYDALRYKAKGSLIQFRDLIDDRIFNKINATVNEVCPGYRQRADTVRGRCDGSSSWELLSIDEGR